MKAGIVPVLKGKPDSSSKVRNELKKYHFPVWEMGYVEKYMKLKLFELLSDDFVLINYGSHHHLCEVSLHRTWTS